MLSRWWLLKPTWREDMRLNRSSLRGARCYLIRCVWSQFFDECSISRGGFLQRKVICCCNSSVLIGGRTPDAINKCVCVGGCVCVCVCVNGSMLASQDALTFWSFYLTSCKIAELYGRVVVSSSWSNGSRGVCGLGWMTKREGGAGSGQTGGPPAVPQQPSVRWNGDVAKNNMNQQQQGSFHSHHSSGSLWAACDCPAAAGRHR